ncbi:MAG: SDR family oxidoreductase, partial [Stackebrandtia sp.]
SQAWPVYDWMGVSKATLESVTRYMARDLGPKGIRVNLVAAGPVRTMAAKSIPGFDQFEAAWTERAPLGWSLTDSTPVAKAVVMLLSDWFPATTGEIVHVDGGFHAIGVKAAGE